MAVKKHESSCISSSLTPSLLSGDKARQAEQRKASKKAAQLTEPGGANLSSYMQSSTSIVK